MPPPAATMPLRAARAPLFHGWKVVAVCLVAAVFAWGLGLFGSSVYLHALTADRGWSVSLVSGAVTLFYLVNAALLPAVGSGIDRWGPRAVLAGGACAIALGVAGLGFVESPWQLYLAFAVMGLGWATLSTTGLSATVAPWFERRQGQTIAIVLMGASVAGIVAAPLLLAGIERIGFRATVALAGALAAAVLLPLILVLLRHRGPHSLGLLPDGAAAPAAPAAASPSPPARRWTWAAAIRTPALQSVAAAFALALLVQVGFLTHHVKIAEPMLGAAGAGLLVSATGLAALLGRFFLAAVADRVRLRRLAALMLALQVLALAALAALPTPAMLIAASLAFGFGVGNVTTLSPIIVRREFGAAAFGAIYGIAATIIQVGLAFGPSVYGLLRDAFGSYGPVLAIAALLDVLALILLLAGRHPPPPSA